MAPSDWDERYSAEQVWSGEPNGALVREAGDLRPGRALDVGCGEGADAIWLAQLGWRVTALDPSSAALARGEVAAATAGVDVDWVCGRLEDAGLARAAFDLVCACYPALDRTRDKTAERALMGCVAPGGTLLVVTHADVDRAKALERGFDPDEMVDVDAVVSSLGDDWEIEVHEQRERSVAGGQGAHHRLDEVLRTRRT